MQNATLPKWGMLQLAALIVLGASVANSAGLPATQRAPRGTMPAAPARIDVWLEPAKPFDPAKPVVIVHYDCVSVSGEWMFGLPSDDDQMQLFTQFVIEADGSKLPTQLLGAEMMDGMNSRKVALKSGESASLVVPIYKIYKVPEDWKVLQITPTRSWVGTGGYTGSTRIVNDIQQLRPPPAATSRR